jgi:two-component sensor histidine kinase
MSQTSQRDQVRELVKAIQNSVADTARIRVLLNTAEHYIRRPGEYAPDLDSASIFISHAERLSDSLGLKHWHLQSRFWKGVVYLEKKEWDEARKTMVPVAAEFEALQDKLWQAKALDYYGGYLPGDSEMLDEKIGIFRRVTVLYKELGNKNAEFKVRRQTEEVHIMQGKLDLAEEALTDLLGECQRNGYKRTYMVHLLLSKIHRTLGNPNRAVYYGLEALKSMETMGITGTKAAIFMELAMLYYYLDDNAKGLEFHLKALEESRKNYHSHVYYKFSLLIATMIRQGQVDKALELTRQVSKEFVPAGDWAKQTVALSFGHCYHALKQYSLAEKYYLSAMETEVQVIDYVFISYSPVAQFYMDRKQFAKARPYLVNMANQRGDVLTASEKSEVYFMLYKVDSALGDYRSALKHISIHKKLSDSIFTAKKTRQLQELHLQYETEKKEQDIQLKAQSIDLLTKQAQLQAQEIEQSRLLRNSTFAGIVVLAVILGLVYNQYRLKQKANNVISSKNVSLQQLVDEKEWLLKEVHHRVKNNLQTVLSLLESQSRYLSNEALHAIQNSQNRVYAMSLIHKKLYQSTDVASIRMDDYLRELVHHLRDSFGPQHIQFNLNLEPIELDVSQAVPIGLIVNEAITNSIKYAFPGKPHGNQITVSVGRSANNREEVLLNISDNGVGLADTYHMKGGSLGLKLIKGLTEDIEGKFSMRSDAGLHIVISFIANTPLQEINSVTMQRFALQT